MAAFEDGRIRGTVGRMHVCGNRELMALVAAKEALSGGNAHDAEAGGAGSEAAGQRQNGAAAVAQWRQFRAGTAEAQGNFDTEEAARIDSVDVAAVAIADPAVPAVAAAGIENGRDHGAAIAAAGGAGGQSWDEKRRQGFHGSAGSAAAAAAAASSIAASAAAGARGARECGGRSPESWQRCEDMPEHQAAGVVATCCEPAQTGGMSKARERNAAADGRLRCRQWQRATGLQRLSPVTTDHATGLRCKKEMRVSTGQSKWSSARKTQYDSQKTARRRETMKLS
jgi:hypothetical protein